MPMSTPVSSTAVEATTSSGLDISLAALDSEFRTTVGLYYTLAARQAENKLFMQRCFRPVPSPQQKKSPAARLPVVRYTCGHSSVDWRCDVAALRCLWCCDLRAVRFARPKELLEHLRTCHGRFRFVIDPSSVDAVGDAVVVIELQLQTGRAGVVAARLEKMTAWDTESVFANIVRFPNYGIPGPNTSESYGAWRTTRYLLRAPGESESRRQVRVAPERKRKRGEKRNSMVAVRENGNVSHQPGQGMRGDGAARLLREYSRQRFMDLLRSCSPITKDCMNEFVSLIMPAGFQAGTARKRLNATRRSTPRSGSESRSLFLLEDQRGPSVPKKQKPPPQPQQPQPLRPQQARSEQPRPQQPRPQQPRRQQQQQPQQQPQQHQHNQQTQQRPVQSKKGSGKQARSSTAHKNGLAFESFADGIDRGIVYRSIIQSRPTPESLEGGDDSDSKEEVIDEIWRLELGDKQLSEFLDTSALEKMYMNLWNKYVSHEVYVFADRYVLDVVVQFALKYGTLLSALHLEVIFVRHLGELCSRGLLDAKGMHEAVVTLGKAKESPRAEQNLTRLRSNFPFYTRVLRRAKGAQRRRGVPPAPPRQMEPPSVQTCCGSGESPDPEQVIVLD